MPKHAPSFKHLIATSSSSKREQPRAERSVNDILAALRIRDLAAQERERERDAVGRDHDRDRAPHLSSSSSVPTLGRPPAAMTAATTGAGLPDDVERAWTVIPGQERSVGLELDDGAVHPYVDSRASRPSVCTVNKTEIELTVSAELLRRAQLAQWTAGRTVAGPAPPPSWRSARNSRPSRSSAAATVAAADNADLSAITEAELRRSSELLSFHRHLPPLRHSGVARLVDTCLVSIMRALHDDTELVEDVDVDTALPPEPTKDEPGTTWTTERPRSGVAPCRSSLTMAEAMREQLPYLPPHLKTALLDTSSLFAPNPSPVVPARMLRLDDTSIRALLSTPAPEPYIGADAAANSSSSSSSSSSSWSADPLTPPEIRHLSLTLHPAPLHLLRDIPQFPGVTLTALNLAYSTFRDLERLVSALPPGLRELSLAGVRLGQGQGHGHGRKSHGSGYGYGYGEEDAKRDMAALGRRMLVLRVLDLSHIPQLASPAAISALLQPPRTRLPSLRILGLRCGSRSVELDKTAEPGAPVGLPIALQREIRAIARDTARPGLIDIVW